jgi:PAS domain-containing protein
MELQLNASAEDINRLRGCIDDLVALLALPAVWTGREPAQIVETLLDVLQRMLRVDLIYARVKDAGTETPVEAIRVGHSCNLKPQDIPEMLGNWFERQGQESPASTPNRLGDKDLSILPVPLGIHGETGMILVGSSRADFPGQTESLLLSVAANQASIGLKEAWLLSEQKRTANQLERQVAERTEGLAAANEKLKNSEAALHKALDEIKKSEAKLRQVIDAIPILAWCNLPDGPNEFLNKGWHEYTGLP